MFNEEFYLVVLSLSCTMSELISSLELEKYLNDTSRVLILHALDGEIWGASIAAIELFGYSNEEFKQMYLANIKPKKLRLSDVCKTQKNEDAAVIFERRNGRRFTASVENQILRTSLLKSTLDLVLLKLSVVNTNVVPFPKSPQFNIQEATDFVHGYSNELHHPIQDIHTLLTELKTTNLSPQQLSLVDQLSKRNNALSFASENIGDSLKLALNLLALDRQPFNIVDLVGEFSSNWGKQLHGFSTSVDRSVPELVYGDKSRLYRIWLSLVNRCVLQLKPKHLTFEVRAKYTSMSPDKSPGKSAEKSPDAILFNIKFDRCEQAENSSSTSSAADAALLAIAESSDLYIVKNLVRMMDGSIKFLKHSSKAYEVELSVNLPEVHDLGLKGNKHFLQQHKLVLIDNTNSLLRRQLYTWGPQIEHFRTTGAALDHLHSHSVKDKEIIIIHVRDKQDLDPQHLEELTKRSGNRTLLIKPEELTLDIGRSIFEIPTPYQPAMLGNVLSQFVHSQFPFPYSNSHRKRRKEVSKGTQRILVVDDSEDTRTIVQHILSKHAFDVDLAVNGIDAVLACAHNQYDFILMDIHLPYMDGFEAVTHLRKVSELNLLTRVIIISGDTSENARVMMKQVGADLQIEKPIDPDYLISTLNNLMQHPSGKIEHPQATKTANEGRRAYESKHFLEAHDVPVNEGILHRLESDTNTDACREMVDMFIEESLIALGEVEKACMAGDWETVASHAQSICSSSMTFGCEALHDLAQQLKQESLHSNFGECMRLAAKLPDVFIKSQQSLYTICNRNLTEK
ncbi:Sensory/regulatory protein RpfC [Thalassocella blandensis]|nr:Sensory/regulatory protein RpfC [Thalassocella blandensis]